MVERWGSTSHVPLAKEKAWMDMDGDLSHLAGDMVIARKYTSRCPGLHMHQEIYRVH